MIRPFEVISLLALSLATYNVSAQSTVEQGRVIIQKNPGGIIETFDLEKTTAVEGSFYMHPDWQVGTITLYDGRKIEKMPLKYNMRDDFMHILDKNEEVRVLKFDRIQSFEWFNVETTKNQTFINCLEFEINGTSLIGFAQVLSENQPQLLKYKLLELSKGNYSVTHDAGQRYDEYVLKEKRYIAVEGILHPANKKKEILTVFIDREDELKTYIKRNRLNLKIDEDLLSLIGYYNTL